MRKFTLVGPSPIHQTNLADSASFVINATLTST